MRTQTCYLDLCETNTWDRRLLEGYHAGRLRGKDIDGDTQKSRDG
jgi:hypothetical protein